MKSLLIAAFVSATTLAGPVTFETLLKEMTDRNALCLFPEPAYTCRQFSSYDRASKTADDAKGWFANGDTNQYLRTEDVGDGKRREWVMADMDGPGAIVRIWSANPKGTLRVYLDNNAAPVIAAPMTELLGGKAPTPVASPYHRTLVKPPLAQEVSRGWNLYLPIPYAKHCKITSDKDGFYYQVNYRTYAPDTAVESFKGDSIEQAQGLIDLTNGTLLDPGFLKDTTAANAKYETIEPGQSDILKEASGPGAVSNLVVYLDSPDLARALRSTILIAEFDGAQTVWCPLGDFFGQVAGPAKFQDYWRKSDGSFMQCLYPMPYAKSARLSLLNLGKAPVKFARTCMTLRGEDCWTPRSMHFHSAWHAEYPIHAYGGKGTRDWNYLEAGGRGVFVGDSLAVMNPVPEWWGEGDEKIYVDGETFPSHFGTGTEDYYGYAWCCPVPFVHPFHAQPRADGHKHGNNNWGYTTVSRVRSLDAIPFTRSFKFDMEIWHWRECEEAYAATTFFYAAPGATTNRKPQPDEAAGPIPEPPPLPPPFRITALDSTTVDFDAGAVSGQTPGITVVNQEMLSFARRRWSEDSQVWVQASKIGDYVEFAIPAGEGPEGKKPFKLTLHTTKSWDYGIIRFSVNGQPAACGDQDLFSGGVGTCVTSGPIQLGTFTAEGGKFILRAQVVGSNPKAEGTRTFFGVDCIVLTPAAK